MSGESALRAAIGPLAAIAGTLVAADVSIVGEQSLFVPLILVALVGAVVLELLIQPPARVGAAAGQPAMALAPATQAAATPGTDPRFDALVADHVALAKSMLEVRDLSSGPAAIGRIDRALTEAGVTRIPVAPGSPFDHRCQYAAAAVPTNDPALDDRVAEVLVDGLAMGPHLLRLPQVSVWRAEPGTTHG